MIIHGARAVLMAARRKQANDKELTLLETLAVNTQARVGHNKATVALANKMARIIFAVSNEKLDVIGKQGKQSTKSN